MDDYFTKEDRQLGGETTHWLPACPGVLPAMRPCVPGLRCLLGVGAGCWLLAAGCPLCPPAQPSTCCLPGLRCSTLAGLPYPTAHPTPATPPFADLFRPPSPPPPGPPPAGKALQEAAEGVHVYVTSDTTDKNGHIYTETDVRATVGVDTKGNLFIQLQPDLLKKLLGPGDWGLRRRSISVARGGPGYLPSGPMWKGKGLLIWRLPQ